MADAYRDDRDALRSKLEETERDLAASQERVQGLESELSIATGSSSRSTGLLRLVAVGVVSAVVGAGVVLVAHRSDATAGDTRWLALHSAEIGVTRVRDSRPCRLRFEHTQSPSSSVPIPLCQTVVTCEHTVYSGVTECGDHQHLFDGLPEESDGDGRIDVDLIAGTMTVDDDAFRF